MLKEDGLSFDSFYHKVKAYRLPGGYRKVHFELQDYSVKVVDIPDLGADVNETDMSLVSARLARFV